MRNALCIALMVLPVFTSCAVLNSRQEGVPARLCGNEAFVDHPSLRDTRAKFSNISIAGPRIQSYTIQTYIHIVSSVGKEKLITNSSIIDQLRFLNNRFLPTGIQFNYVNVSRSVNTSWAYSTVRFLIVQAQSLLGLRVYCSFFIQDAVFYRCDALHESHFTSDHSTYYC
jgi:hypothetical protein